jgi:hypothetical protein
MPNWLLGRGQCKYPAPTVAAPKSDVPGGWPELKSLQKPSRLAPDGHDAQVVNPLVIIGPPVRAPRTHFGTPITWD